MQAQPLSRAPSQSSSIWFPQTSAVGVPGTALHSTPDPSAVQTTVPEASQAPTPAVHEVPNVGQVSSVIPSQSSSAPLQDSTAPGLMSGFESSQSAWGLAQPVGGSP